MPGLDPCADTPDLTEALILPQVLDNASLLETDLAGAGTVWDQKCQFTIGIATETAAFGQVTGQCFEDDGFYTPVLFGLSEKPAERAFRATVEGVRGTVFPGHQRYLQRGNTLKL